MSGVALEFLAEANICGQTLLRLVSRGSAIIAELLRLCDHIPGALASGDENPMAAKYAPVLFDFRYLKTPEMFDKQVNVTAEMGDLDEEFFASHEEVLARFYKLFESVYKYVADYNKFLSDLQDGFYIQHTVADVLLDTDGKQLMCEALYLWGVMLLLMDMRVPGPIRERLIVAHYRKVGESREVPIVELAKLCRDTGFRPADPHGKARPVGYPENYFARFTIPPSVIAQVRTRLRSDDVYNQTRVYPAPEHRSFALAGQASMLYVILYFSPLTLANEKKEMREIVDKHYSDNWVVPIYMGILADLTLEWERYRAAREALAMDTLKPEHVRKLIDTHRGTLMEVDKALTGYLTEGVLTETYVVDTLGTIMDCLRHANTSLRWILLHRRTEHKVFRALILDPRAFQRSDTILDYMLRTSLLELRLKSHIKHLLGIKGEKWERDRTNTADMMLELSDYFSGSKALTRVARDEDLMTWFTNLAAEIRALDYGDAIMAGRKIRQLIKALEEVQQFDVIDATANIKEFLALARTSLLEMVRTCNVTETTMADIGTISDVSFAWETIRDYVGDMHERVKRDPQSVSVLRALFLKLVSVVETPLIRVTQADSRDALSVAEYYSGEVVGFLRRVMEVIPVIVFQTLEGIIKLQTKDMKALPIKFEWIHLRDLSQVEARHELAYRTHQISVFTEGTLAMKKTLLGVIKVDPRDILHDGIRKHLVDQISRAFHVAMVFDTRVGRGKDPKANIEAQLSTLRDVLGGFRKSFEYVQDYIGIYGLRMWQEEFTRILAFNTEQECNKFLRRRVLPDASRHQSTAIPIPLFLRPPVGDTSGSITFMGRLVDALVHLTDPRRTVYGPGCLGGGWYEGTGREVGGLSLFAVLNEAMGVPGLTGIDRLLGFSIERDLSRISKAYGAELKAGAGDMLLKLTEELQPTTSLSPVIIKHFTALFKKITKPMDVLLDALITVGQAQLLRRAIAHELRFACRLDSNLLSGALEALNTSVTNDIRKHYYDAESHPMPDGDSELLPAVARYAEASGLDDPLTNIYVTTEPQPFFGLWITLLCVVQMSKFGFDREFGTLVRRKPTEPVDGAPFVVGIATLLKQLHPSATVDWLSYMGQYVRTTMFAAVGAARVAPVPAETINLLLLAQHVARVAHIPDSILHAHFPPYFYETVGTVA